MRLSAAMLATAVFAVSPLAAAEPSPSTVPVPVEPTHVLISPCFGAGYVPYSYPGVETCPCAYDACFPPARYYCGGDAYRKHWLRKWLKAHFCGGSMLDDSPCHCVFPTTGRAWLPVVE